MQRAQKSHCAERSQAWWPALLNQNVCALLVLMLWVLGNSWKLSHLVFVTPHLSGCLSTLWG